MQKLVWQNANGDEINLTGGNYGITEWEGFSNASLNIQNQQVPFQDGAVFLDALIEPRELSVTLKMQDKGNLEERYRMRRELIHSLNPKLGEGYLIYTNDFISKRIKCIPQIPLFETHNSDTRGTPKASLAWTACEPYWEDLEETVVEFGINEQPIVKNEGDIPAQVKMDFITANVINPSITRINGNIKIQYNGTLNDTLKINTNIGQKEVMQKVGINSVSGINIDYKSICYNSAQNYYYVLAQNHIFRSKDLNNWIYCYTLAESATANKIVYSEEKDEILLILSNGNIYRSKNGTTWENVAILGINLIDIIYCTGLHKYYVLSESGYVSNSSDTINWVTPYQVTTQIANFILYCKTINKFIIGGYTEIYTSSDGDNWTNTYTSSGGEDFYAGAFAEERNIICVVGSLGTIKTSNDGITWTTTYSEWQDSRIIISIAYVSTLETFIAVVYTGYGSQNMPLILKSRDGINWTAENLTTNYLFHNIAFFKETGYSVLLGIGLLEYTTNGNFELPEKYYFSQPNGYSLLKYFSKLKKYVFAIDRCIYISDDLDKWELNYIVPEQNVFIEGLACSNEKVCAITQTRIYITDNFEAWTNTEISGVVFTDLIYVSSKTKFYALGNGYLYSSIDGENWEMGVQIDTYLIDPHIMYSDFYNKFIVYNVNKTYESTNESDWIVIINDRINSIAETDNGYILGFGNTNVYKCYDGTTWTSETGVDLEGLLYINNKKYFIGIKSNENNYTEVYFSYDGTVWKLKETLPFQLKDAYIKEIEELIFMYEYVVYTKNDNYINAIQKLSKESDINFNLEIGDNKLRLNYISGDFICKLSYRQKYLGV